MVNVDLSLNRLRSSHDLNKISSEREILYLFVLTSILALTSLGR